MSLTSLYLPLTENRLFAEDSIHAAFLPFGVTKSSFRAFLRALGVPHIQIGRTRFIDALSLGVALRAVTRIGNKPFASPGTRAARKRDGSHAYDLDPRYVERNLVPILQELAAARHLSWKKTGESLAKDINRAARALAHGLSRNPPDERLEPAVRDAPSLTLPTSARTPGRPKQQRS